MRRFRELPVALVVVAAIAALAIPYTAESQADAPRNKILARALAVERGAATPRKNELAVSGA